MRHEIVGRRAERARIVDTVTGAGDHGFSAIVLDGEPGIGKTALWRAGVEAARGAGAIVLTAQPTSVESRLPYSALGDVVRDVPRSYLSGLSEPVGSSLQAASLVAPGLAIPDARLVMRGLADLLADIARSEPLVVAIDDIQWLDEPSRVAFAFALRRLASTNARVLLARRPPVGVLTEIEDSLPAPDLDILSLGPLSLSALQGIVTERTGASLPRTTLVRVARASGGNPYYALEMARELTRSGAGAAVDARLPRDVTRLTANRLLRLPESTRAALLDLALSARQALEDTTGALEPAIDEGVVERDVDGSLRFSHPLLAAAAIDIANPEERRTAHLALAEAEPDEVERARHLALAARSQDAAAADGAEAGARLAEERGNAVAALELSELALRLTPRERPSQRLERAEVYAECLDAAGATPEARAVLEREIAAAPPTVATSSALLKLGWVCWRDQDFEAGIVACTRAIDETTDLARLAEAYETLTWLNEEDLDRARESAEKLVQIRDEQGDVVLAARARLLAAYFSIVTGHPPDHERISADIDILEDAGMLDQNPVPEMWAKFTDRLDDSRSILARRLTFAREQNDEQFTVACLFALGEVDTWRGAYAGAREAFDAALQMSDDLAGSTYLSSLHASAGQLAALEGRSDDAYGHAQEALRASNKAILTALAEAALGSAELAAGRPVEADAAFSRATEALDRIGMREPARFRYDGDHLEAIVALGDIDRARCLVERLADRLAVFERPWLRVQVDRGRAQVAGADGLLEDARSAAEAALAASHSLPMPLERARTELVLGRLLRRDRQRGEARRHLEAALAVFESLPAPRYAAMAREELARLGLSRVGTELTEGESAVARAAASGLKNREIAEHLFMSPKTVEAHLARAYRKLGIRSRAELGARLGDRPSSGPKAEG